MSGSRNRPARGEVSAINVPPGLALVQVQFLDAARNEIRDLRQSLFDSNVVTTKGQKFVDTTVLGELFRLDQILLGLAAAER